MTSTLTAPRAATVDTRFAPVTRQAYAAALRAAWLARPEIRASLTDYRDPDEIGAHVRAYLTRDGASGYLITLEGELCGVFSTVRGRGAALVADAVDRGATALDCFDGYLPGLYARHGFREVRRESNWTPGGPDVVYMRRTA